MSDARQPGHPIAPAFTNRWSPRAFTGERLPADVLMTLFEAARWAPSASNIQPWRFSFAHTGTPAFQALLETLGQFNQDWARTASALVVVVSAKEAPGKEPGSTRPNRWHSFDTGAAWMSLALQATEMGLSTHGMGGFDADAARQTLQLPEHFEVEAVLAVGKQGDPAQLPEALQSREAPNQRRPLAEIVTEFVPGQPFALKG